MSKKWDSRVDGAEHDRRKADSAGKIEAQDKRGKAGHPSEKQQADDQQLMNEMRSNKASVDLNRAMHEYDEENDKERKATSREKD